MTLPKTLLAVAFGLTTFLVQPHLVSAVESIPLFQSDITINKDTSITIHETITYTTSISKHGIYRYIPVSYERGGLRYTVQVHDIQINDENNQSIPFEKSYGSGNVTLKIGDPDRTFEGEKIYNIRYTVDNALQMFEAPELYWDITGEGWQIQIEQTKATIYSPVGAITKVECYSGAFGSDDKLCQKQIVDSQTAVFTYPHSINYGQNMTVAVGLDPASVLRFPTPLEKAIKMLWDNLILLPLLIPGLVLGIWWWRSGRDRMFVSANVFNHDESQPQLTTSLLRRLRVPFVYEPLKDLTPGEAGAIIDEKVDHQDVIAEIIDLARKKYLKIERTDKKKLLGTETDYVFTQLKVADGSLPKHQAYLLEKIFKSGKTVKMSALKGTFYTHVEQVKKQIMASLKQKGLFKGDPTTSRSLGFALAFVLGFICFYWMIFLTTQGIVIAVPLFIGSAVVALLSAYFLPAKTATGSNYAMQARGLKETIARGTWREKIKEKHLFFEEVLPFAIALGVVDRLSRDMESLNVKPPEYLSSGLNQWHTASFINSFQSQASSQMMYNPSSSSSSSGSGFSGGSSGGGGGGGGGGSW